MKPEYTAYAITLVGVMGVSAIAPALPTIAKAIGISRAQAGLLITAFTLPGIFFSPVTGVMADKFGRKYVASLAILLFGLSGFLCQFVDFKTMLMLRLIQGISASSLVALSTTIIGDTYTGIHRERIIGYNASILTTGIAFYQLAGGYLAKFSWRYPFFIFLLAIPAGVFVLVSPLPDVRGENNFSEFLSRSFSKMLFLFLTGMTAYAILYGAFLTYLPFAVSRAGGSSATIGAIQATMSLSTAFFAANLARISRKLGRSLLSVGFLAYSVSLLGFLLSTLTSCELCFFLPSVLFGYAQGTVLPTLQNSIVSMTEEKGRATVMSIYGSVSKLGQTLGPVFFGFFSLEGVYTTASAIALFVSVTHTFQLFRLKGKKKKI